MSYKTKEAARKAAHAEMGAEAIEGIDFIVKGVSNGWVFEGVPAANDAAKGAQGKRAVSLKAHPGKIAYMTDAQVTEGGFVQAKAINGEELWTEPDNPWLVDGVVYHNATRAGEARRALAAREAAKASPAPQNAAREAAKKSVANKRASRKEAAKPAPKKAAAPKAKAPKAPKAAPPAKKAAKQRPAAPEGTTKSALIIEMLSTPGGATSKEMEARTGWAPHSVRGFLGTLRSKGVNVASKKLPKEPTIYRIVKTKTAKAPAEAVGDVI